MASQDNNHSKSHPNSPSPPPHPPTTDDTEHSLRSDTQESQRVSDNNHYHRLEHHFTTGTNLSDPSTEATHQSSLSTHISPSPLTTIHESSTLISDSNPRQSRSLVARNHPSLRSRSSSAITPSNRRLSPYTRPFVVRRSNSLPHSTPTSYPTTVEMSSSSSSPGNTSTAGSSSGSNPSYQLPYAPFPYPMPSQGNNSQGSGSGK